VYVPVLYFIYYDILVAEATPVSKRSYADEFRHREIINPQVFMTSTQDRIDDTDADVSCPLFQDNQVLLDFKDLAHGSFRIKSTKFPKS